jgi:hypothetical protein
MSRQNQFAGRIPYGPNLELPTITCRHDSAPIRVEGKLTHTSIVPPKAAKVTESVSVIETNRFFDADSDELAVRMEGDASSMVCRKTNDLILIARFEIEFY